jgi:rod shape-determining protein MreC
MTSYTDPPEVGRGRRDLTVVLVFLFLSGVALYMPSGAQGRIGEVLKATVLKPFILTQMSLVRARLRAEDAMALQARLDSLAAIVAIQAPLAEENRELRELLDLQTRAPATFVHTNVIRPGTAGSQSVFLIDVGSDRGVRPGDPVLMRSGRIGLLGKVQEVTRRGAVCLDWTHPEFRASAMTADGETQGLVEPRPGDIRGGYRLLLNAIPYNEPIAQGTLITTSGQGGIFPRGIPIGEVLELNDNEGGWRSEYWLQPVVEPGSVTHALVVTGATFDEDLFQRLEEGAETPGRGEGASTGGDPPAPAGGEGPLRDEADNPRGEGSG